MTKAEALEQIAHILSVIRMADYQAIRRGCDILKIDLAIGLKIEELQKIADGE